MSSPEQGNNFGLKERPQSGCRLPLIHRSLPRQPSRNVHIPTDGYHLSGCTWDNGLKSLREVARRTRNIKQSRRGERQMPDPGRQHRGRKALRPHSRSPLALTVSACYMVVGSLLSYLQVPGEFPGYFLSIPLGVPVGRGERRDVQQVLRRYRLFQEELAQASPRQAEIGGYAPPQGAVTSPPARSPKRHASSSDGETQVMASWAPRALQYSCGHPLSSQRDN